MNIFLAQSIFGRKSICVTLIVKMRTLRLSLCVIMLTSSAMAFSSKVEMVRNAPDKLNIANIIQDDLEDIIKAENPSGLQKLGNTLIEVLTGLIGADTDKKTSNAETDDVNVHQKEAKRESDGLPLVGPLKELFNSTMLGNVWPLNITSRSLANTGLPDGLVNLSVNVGTHNVTDDGFQLGLSGDHNVEPTKRTLSSLTNGIPSQQTSGPQLDGLVDGLKQLFGSLAGNSGATQSPRPTATEGPGGPGGQSTRTPDTTTTTEPETTTDDI